MNARRESRPTWGEVASQSQVTAAVAGRDGQASALSRLACLTGDHSFHHRKLRSQGGEDAPENLVLLTGSGTTGEHGWVHAHPIAAELVGLIVPPGIDPATWPIWRVGILSGTRGWHLQTRDGNLRRIRIADVMKAHDHHFVLDSRHALAAHQTDISTAIAQLRLVIADENGDVDD